MFGDELSQRENFHPSGAVSVLVEINRKIELQLIEVFPISADDRSAVPCIAELDFMKRLVCDPPVSSRRIQFVLLAWLVLAAAPCVRADDQNVAEEVRLLREQNATLQKQMSQQSGALDALTQKVKQLESAQSTREIAAGENPPAAASGLDVGKIHLSAEGAVAFFSTGNKAFAPRVDYSQMRDFVGFIEGIVVANTAPATNLVFVTTSRVAQKGAQFAPHILPVMAGMTVEWPNHDDIFHNVFSISDAKEFDLGLYKDSPLDKRVTFDKPGKVDVYCSIHANMSCVVLENPYFATTDAAGKFTIKNLPRI